MSAITDKQTLVQMLIDEASDVDLVCYLAHSGGAASLQDLLECIRDAESLPVDDLLHNIAIVRKKKVEASACPMSRIFRRLMRPDIIRVGPSISIRRVTALIQAVSQPAESITPVEAIRRYMADNQFDAAAELVILSGLGDPDPGQGPTASSAPDLEKADHALAQAA
jgi:hypothetical protein